MLRKVQKRTQSQLAERAGVSQAAIADYEKHGVPSGVPLAIVMHIADALGAPLSLLVYGTEEEEQEALSEAAQSPKKVVEAKRRLKKSAAKTRG
mgnify:FL=1